jgi:hypothetical protein
MEALGPAFMVFRAKVQKDLKVSDEQKQKLAKRLQNTVQDARPFFQKLADTKPEEREKELQSYRQKVQKKLAAFLKETLTDGQLKRLRQLELQQEGPFALFVRPDLGKKLKITDKQRKQFMGVVQELQKKIEPLIKKTQSGGNPQEIRPKVMKIRKEHEDRIEVILSDAQKKQWKEMLGKQLDDPGMEVPDEARRHVVEALGTPFLLFRDKVQKELKLTDEQVKKVDERMKKTVQETQQFFQKLQATKEDKRPKEMHEYRQKAHAKLAEFVKKTLKEDQRKRLRQIELQHDGLFALGRQDVQDELKITDEQQKKFMDLVHKMEKKIQPLIQGAQQKGKPDEIRPKVMKIRTEHEGKIEALLTDAQKKQWKEIRGKPLDLDD